jgi:hypothetical protein
MQPGILLAFLTHLNANKIVSLIIHINVESEPNCDVYQSAETGVRGAEDLRRMHRLAQGST